MHPIIYKNLCMNPKAKEEGAKVKKAIVKIKILPIGSDKNDKKEGERKPFLKKLIER
jgi:hypothetical protein